MKRTILIALLALSFNAFSQIAATTEDGRKVELKSDGTWCFIVEEMPQEGGDVLNIEPCSCLYEYIKNEVDEFTGKRTIMLKPFQIGVSETKDKLMASVGQVGEQYVVTLLYMGDLGCMSSRSRAIFKFADGSTLELDHAGKTDCGNYMKYMGNATLDIAEFRTKVVDKIRLHGTEYYSDIPVKKGSFFMEAFNCCCQF